MFSLIEIKKTAKVAKPIIGETAPGGASTKIKGLYNATAPLKIFSKAVISNIRGINSLIFKTTSKSKQDKTSCEKPHWANIEIILFEASGI